MKRKLDKERFIKEVQDNLKRLYRVDLEEATQQQKFMAVAEEVEDIIIDDWMASKKANYAKHPKTVIYLSMEFLVGRALGNNLLNLCVYDDVKEALEEIGIDLNAIEDEESEPALGNGGLGRLAACFLDSLATGGYSAYGCGIRYHYGMFKQKIKDGFQVEAPDNWLKTMYPFELKRPEYAKEIRFGGNTRTEYDEKLGKNRYLYENYSSVRAVPYDMPIVGYGNHGIDTLRLWDAEAINDFELEAFDKGDYQKAVEQENLARTITEVLYPNDNHESGKELRLKQQYFFISASLQAVLDRFVKTYGSDFSRFPEKYVFQMNDTHPSMAVAELMRLLMDEYHLEWDEAWEIVTASCAYTNHTIMQEALEKWPTSLFSRLLPRVYQIIEEINRRFLLEVEAKFPGDAARKNRMSIIGDGQVRMAFLAIAGSYSVNGVAALHTEILKNNVLHDFYEMWPDKFSNKTNGVTQRRFVEHGNPLLAAYITEKAGDGWQTDWSKIGVLKDLVDDPAEQKAFMDIKHANKVRLAEYIKKNNNIDVDPDAIFDVQVKRLHEYKRQLLNILHVMFLYNQIRENPQIDLYPRTFIFGAKASAGYQIAKLIIKLINSVADVVNNDPVVAGRIKVVFIENYRVSNGEIIFAAADVSEQISTASREASGTGNMKFMMNGAPTLGTMDGANVEIVEEVGEDNAFIFGLSAEEVLRLEQNRQHNPRAIYDFDKDLHRVIDQLIDGTYSQDRELFRPIYESILNGWNGSCADPYFILADFRSYADAQKRVEEAYKDRSRWARMAMMNTACSGKFSSDRTIKDYVDDIWGLQSITVDVEE